MTLTKGFHFEVNTKTRDASLSSEEKSEKYIYHRFTYRDDFSFVIAVDINNPDAMRHMEDVTSGRINNEQLFAHVKGDIAAAFLYIIAELISLMLGPNFCGERFKSKIISCLINYNKIYLNGEKGIQLICINQPNAKFEQYKAESLSSKDISSINLPCPSVCSVGKNKKEAS
jgi:hypothetical protein